MAKDKEEKEKVCPKCGKKMSLCKCKGKGDKK